MKIKYILFAITIITGLCTSCVEDLGNYDYKTEEELLPVEIASLESRYAILQAEELAITPEFIKMDNENRYTYLWYTISQAGGQTPVRDTLAQTKDLDVVVKLKAGTYKLYFEVRDPKLGIYVNTYSSLEVTQSNITSGWFILKDQNDQTDFDYINLKGEMTKNVLQYISVDKQLKGKAKKIIYQNSRYYHQQVNENGTVTLLNNQKAYNLNYYLLDLFDWWTVKYLQDIFFIGGFSDGAITFPYIDANGKLRSLKRQQYDRETGKRSKTENSYLLHKALSGNDSFNYKGCLFGMHQIRAKYSKGKTICIVEGEKSAVIASGQYPKYIWMATGARDWFNEYSLEPIKDRKIILFPDTSKDGKTFEKWQQIADKYKDKGYYISVSDMLEKRCTQEQKEQGYDIGDLLHNDLVKEKPALLTEPSPEPMPEIKVDEFPPMVKEMIAANPALLNLINTFDLVAV